MPPLAIPELIGGPYAPPTDREPYDAVLGRHVRVKHWTDARISWPVRRVAGHPVPVCSDELVRAVQTESSRAMQYWFGFRPSMVTRLRRACEAGHWADVPGTKVVKRQAREGAEDGPERRSKTGAASAKRNRGNPAVAGRLRAAVAGRTTRPVWTAVEDAYLLAHGPKAAAAHLGRPLGGVRQHYRNLRRAGAAAEVVHDRRADEWTPEEDAVVLGHPPAEAARRLPGRSRSSIYARRHRLRSAGGTPITPTE